MSFPGSPIQINPPALARAYTCPRAALVVYRHHMGRPHFLLISTRRNPGRLTLPGGKVDPGESHVTAAARETLEAAGVLTDAHRVLGRYQHEKVSGKTYSTQTFLARYAGYQINHERRTLHWLTLADIWDLSQAVQEPVRRQLELAMDMLPVWAEAA